MREISIEEMPQGCILTHDRGQSFTVSSFEDAAEIIESLQRMIAAQHRLQADGDYCTCKDIIAWNIVGEQDVCVVCKRPRR